MLYMVVETFRDRDVVYRRFGEKGRMLPKGLEYISSWIDRDVTRCFQLMETEVPDRLNEWTSKWDDIADFEIVPVITSDQAREVLSDQRGDNEIN
ncbi:MAG: DUF3303 family protein [Pyrinomonadaceae bacterium]